jgi:dTDP-4-dehydrorhamnose 3,5-epimerase
VGAYLSADNHAQLWIPPGFGHGFLTLSDTAEFLYKTTDYYSPESERSVHWADPVLAIEWPDVGPLSLAARDAAAPMVLEAEVFD